MIHSRSKERNYELLLTREVYFADTKFRLIDERTTIGVGTSLPEVQKTAEFLNPLSNSGSLDAIFRFGRRDPATLRGFGSAGITIQHEFRDLLQGNINYSLYGE